jgi:CubicO group peptidase (beta-lactamase class C family)
MLAIRLRLVIGGILLMLFVLWLIMVNAQNTTATFSDPNGLYSFEIPADWVDESTAEFNVFSNEGNTYTYLIAVPATDIDSGIREAIDITIPEFASEPVQTTTSPAPNGVWTQKVYILPNDSMLVAVGQLVNDVAYVLILEAPDETSVQAVSNDFTRILLSFTIGTAIDLTNVQAQTITSDMLADLETYIHDIRAFYDVPGATIAIVQDGEVIYSQGFGVVAMDTQQAVSTDTLFMVGSTTKSMTTMMMATLVDDGILDWDIPAQDVLPNFSLSNGAVTNQIRIRDFFSNGSGVATYNVLRFLVNQTPEQVIESLATVPMIALPGEAYSYSNLMFAIGGYAASNAITDGDTSDLYRTYTTLIQERIFEPIGMVHTTFDFDAAVNAENHASPHTFDVVEGQLDLIPVDWERFVVPVAPAGAAWSTVDDMALYLMTQLNQGTAPDGTVVVSEANLSETQQAGINISGDIYYGMGWVIDSYNGLPLIWHNGGTQGFTADIAFLPETNLGVVVLTNKGNADNFTRSIREYVFELGFSLEHEADAHYRAMQVAFDAALEETIQDITFVPVDAENASAYVGDYEMGISIIYDETNGMALATDYGTVPLVAVEGQQETFYAQNGLILTFSRNSDGAVTLAVGVLDDPLQTIIMQRSELHDR